MATRQYLLSSSRAGLGSAVVTRDTTDSKTYLIPNVGATFTFVPTYVANMDGYAQMVAYIPIATGVAHMDGATSFFGISYGPAIAGAGRMDGHASMTSPTPEGARVAYLDGVASMAAVGSNTYKLSLLETINLADAVSRRMRIRQVIQETTIRLSSSLVAPHARFAYILTDRVNVQPETLIPTWRTFLGLAQNLTIHPATSQKFIWGRILTQVVMLSAAVTTTGTYKKSLAQLFKLNDVDGLNHSIPIVLSQSINLHLSQAAGFSLKLLQKFLVSASSSRMFNYHLALTSQVIINSIIDHFRSAVLTQLFTLHDVSPTHAFTTNSSLNQLLTVHPALNTKLLLKIVGNLQVSPEQIINMLYRGDELLDGVVITALYVSPSGTTTTWAVNTRTNAVTEYLNYSFRSFAQMENRYIAAGAEGLYELDGDTDDGALIISEMMSGYLQLNEKKLFGIKGAYIAIRGGGRFYLKLIAGDGREYVYELKAQPNLMTTKIKVGKGLSTTYMAFDLITEGQDWDLDSLEFIPMTRGRRV